MQYAAAFFFVFLPEKYDMKQTLRIFCLSDPTYVQICQLVHHLRHQSYSILSLHDLLRTDQGTANRDSVCSLVIRSVDEELLVRLPRLCQTEQIFLSIFLGRLISDECIASLHREERTPLFAEVSLLYQYSVDYLRQRMHLQVLFADLPVGISCLELLRDCRTRIVLSCHEIALSGIWVINVTEAPRIGSTGGTDQPPTVSLPVKKPILTSGTIAPYLAISERWEAAVIAGKCKRVYNAANGAYGLSWDLSSLHTVAQKEDYPSMQALVNALQGGSYPLLHIQERQDVLVFQWEEQTSIFCVCGRTAPGVWQTFQMPSSQLLQPFVSCTYLQPATMQIPVCCSNFIQELHCGYARELQSYLWNLYRTDSDDEIALASIETFLQERIMLAELICKEVSEKDLCVPSINEHLLLLEQYIRPILHIMEQRQNPFVQTNRLLLADDFSKILLSEERCIDAYLEEIDREQRYREWETLFRKKAQKT